MPEGVGQPGAPGTEHLIDGVPVDGRTSAAGLPNQGIDVVDVQHQTHWRAHSRAGRDLALARELISHIHAAVTNRTSAWPILPSGIVNRWSSTAPSPET